MKNLSAEARRYLYGIAAAVVAALLGLGIITAEQAPLWLAAAAAVLTAAGNLVAIANTTSVGRSALYGVALSAVALLVVYNILPGEQAPLWLGVLAALLGIGTNSLAATKVIPGEKADEVFVDGEPLGEGEIRGGYVADEA